MVDERGFSVDKKLKIKLNKQLQKYTVDYSRVLEKDKLKFEIFSKVNQQYECLLMINSALDMSKNGIDDYRGLNLLVEQDYNELMEFLTSTGCAFSLRRRSREVQKSVLGFTTGKKEIVKDVLLAVGLKRGELDQKMFDKLCLSHDFMLAVDPKEDLDKLVQDFEKGEFSSADETKSFNYTVVDSQWMKFFFSNIDTSFYS